MPGLVSNPLSSAFEHLRQGAPFATGGRVVAESDLIAFASLTGDRHPLHLDADWAENSPFGERIAPAALTLSLALGLLPIAPERAVALRRMEGAVFTRPVAIGDTLAVAGRVAALSPVDEATGLVTLSVTVVNQHRQTVCRVRVQILWRRDGAETPDR